MSFLESFDNEFRKFPEPKKVGKGYREELEGRRKKYHDKKATLDARREAYIKEHPETKDLNGWQVKGGKVVPRYEAEVCVKNTTAIKNEVFQNFPRLKSLRSAAFGLLVYFIYHRNFPEKKDKHNTREVWYHQRGLIVASRSINTIAKDFGVHRSTILDWIEALEKDGLLRRELENRENVYVIGQIVDNREVYFYAKAITDTQL
jgi:hypothetical protein